MTHKFVTSEKLLSLKAQYRAYWLEKAHDIIQDEIAIYFLLDFKATYYKDWIDYEPFFYADYETVGDFLESKPRVGLLSSNVLKKVLAHCFYDYVCGFNSFAKTYLLKKERKHYKEPFIDDRSDLFEFFQEHESIVEEQIRKLYPLPLREFIESTPKYEKYWYQHMMRSGGKIRADLK